MDNWGELWDTVQLVHPGSPLPPKDLEIQLNNFGDKFLNLFANKGPDAGKRQEVRSGKVQTPNMELTLDYDARTKLVPELSDMLQLDEHTCAELLKTVLDKFGTYMPEAACGVYLSERALGARTLCRLLLLQLFNQLDVKISQDATGADASGAFNSIRECLEGDPLLGVVVRNNDALLGVEAGGRNKLVSRIVAVAKDHTMDTRGYDVVWTNPSERTTREALLMEERADLCRALLYAVVLSPRQLKPSSLADVLSLLEQLVGQVKAAGPAAPHLLVQQASSVLLAAVAALSLLNVAGGTDAAPAAMADLLRSPELKEQLDKLAKPDSGFSAVMCLTWALTKDAVASSSSSSRGGSAAGGQQQLGGPLGGPGFDGTTPGPTSTALLEVAGKARALGTLAAVLSNVAFQLEAEEEHKHLCARIVYGLVTDALQFDANNHRELTQRLLEVSSQHNREHASSSRGGTWAPTGIESDLTAFAFPAAPPAAAAPGAAGALAVAGVGTAGTFFAGQQHPQLPVLAQHDDLSSLLEALAAVYRVRPGLWHDREAPAAFPYVTTFMSHVVVHPGVSQLPDVMVSILGVMTALAAGPKGSRFILMQFRQNVAQEKLQGFTWARLFGSIITYCQRYDVLERQAAARGDIANQQPGLLAAKAAALMAPGDAMLLVAYLDLLTAVIASGEAEEVRASLQGLERDLAPVTGGGSISEPLFQLMCHGVPTRVKAAVDRCLIAMARFKEVAPHLLQRLVAAAVVNAGSTPMEYSGYNPYDLMLQFNEAEARQEDYSETLAFLDLVNALLTTLGPTGLPEGAIGIAHYTHFVLQHVVAHLWARNYKEPAQKWQLAAAVFRHCQLVLDALATWPENLGTQYMLSRPPPGLSVLVALMSSSQLERALLTHVLGAGHTALEASVQSGTEGPHRLAAVLAGFRLLNTALGYDAGAAQAINSATTRERVTPLHLQLAHPKGRLPVLLQYVLYYNMDLQYEAIRLLSQLAARLPDMVHLLQPHMDDTAAIIIRQGFAMAFELALLDPSAGESVSAGLSAARDVDEADGEAPAPSSDSRADLLLDVMIGTLCTEGEPPSLAHLLLGFDVNSIPTEWWQTELHPEHDLSCLSVVLRALQEPDLHLRKPALFAKCLQLLYCIAEPPLTCELVFSLLQPSNEVYGQLLPHLGSLLVEGLPGATGLGQGGSEADVHQQVAALRQRAALLQVYSLALLRYKLPSMLEPLLAVLVGPGSGAAATAAAAAGYSNGASAALQPYASASGTAALLALQHVCGVALPQQGIEIPAELQQIQQEMTVDDISVSALLSQPSVMESAGVVTADEYGQPVFDFAVLRRLLHERYEDYVSKTGGRGSPSEAAASQAVAAAFSHAAALNAHALVAGAQSFAVKAWVQTASISFTKTYAFINRSTAPGCGPELLHSTLLGTLQLVAGLSSRGQMGLAAELAGCCRVLMSKLQELAAASLSLGLPGDPLSQVRLPVRCEALLRLLLECLRGASSKYQRGGRDGSSNALRAEMYVCLIQYMHFCRGSKLGDCPPLVLSCLLSGAGPGTSAAQLDALQQQLEEVNGRLLRSCASELVGLMLPDILQPPHRGGMAQAVALHLLATLLSADKSSTALAEVCYREKVPKALLDSVVAHAEGVVMQHSSKAQGALQVLEGQLFLLLSLTMAGGPMAQKASTKAVADAGVLPALARCKALNYLPEGPSDAMRQNKAGTRRYRLVRLVCPVLRLVLSLLGGAPGSAKMVSEALEFCRGQHKLLGRLLKEAAAPASPSWTPGDEELEQAALAVSLLARLPGALRSHDALLAAGAGAAASMAGSLSGLRDDMWQLWQALAGHDKSEAAASGILVMMAHDSTAAGGSSRMQLERRRSLLLQLRVGLAACLRDLVKPAAGAGGAAAAGGGGGAGAGVLGPGASELLQLVGPDNHMTMDVLGRPTLLQVHNTADQAVGDVRGLAQDLESLLAFLSRSEAGIIPEDVSTVLSHWGPSLAALSGKPEAAGARGAAAADGGGSGNSMSSALVVAGQDGQQGQQALVVAGAAGSFGGLDPAAARRLARQCAAKGASVLLGQLSKQLSLIEQCLVIVLLHLVQCLPRPDSSAVLDAGADDMQLDTADGSVEDALLPNPGPEMAAVLGDADALRFFAARMRNVCGQAAGMGCEVRKVLGGGADSSGGPAAAAAVGTRQWLDSVDAIDLLTRRLNAYLADR